jgi:hypothetical protein
VQVDQVRREHVQVEHAREGFGLAGRGFGQPFGRVVHDGAQAVGVGFQRFDEGENPGFAGEIGEQADGTQIAQCLYARAFAAVGEDDATAFFEQPLCAMQTDTLAGTGDKDRGGGIRHERLASRWEQKL